MRPHVPAAGSSQAQHTPEALEGIHQAQAAPPALVLLHFKVRLHLITTCPGRSQPSGAAFVKQLCWHTHRKPGIQIHMYMGVSDCQALTVTAMQLNLVLDPARQVHGHAQVQSDHTLLPHKRCPVRSVWAADFTSLPQPTPQHPPPAPRAAA